MERGKLEQFARATNDVDLGARGDPERWGSSVDFRAALGVQIYSQQVIRVQCSDLVARTWDLFVSWDIYDLAQFDILTRWGLEVTVGLGQGSVRRVIDLQAALLGPNYLSNPAGGPNYLVTPGNPWEVTQFNGSVISATYQLPIRIPAVALAARFVVQADTTNPDEHEHTVHVTAFAAVAPVTP